MLAQRDWLARLVVSRALPTPKIRTRLRNHLGDITQS